MPNTIAINVLHEYLDTQEPGYALLINAPWGAGKTEFIRRQTEFENKEGVLYLSLFGIDSPDAFNEALLAAILKSPGNELKKRARAFGEKAKDLISNFRGFGFSINLSSYSLLEGLNKDLPNTLIFDDLERITMPQATMAGLLNRFIEHDKKQVVLIANTEKIQDDEKKAFDTTREKRIGRSIQIVPDVDAALQSYWAAIPEGRGKTYLQNHQTLIKDIFEEGEHGNLRLLRMALQATSSFLDKIAETYFEFSDQIERLTATFLALHMAYGSGRIGESDLQSRSNPRAFGRDIFGAKTPDEQIQALVELEAAHPNCDIQTKLMNSTLPVDLCKALLVDGYASADFINEQLRGTYLFRSEDDTPDWIKLWRWDELPVPELEIILSKLATKLKANEITNPGELVIIYGSMDFLTRCGGMGQTREQLSKEFYEYIKRLSASGKLRPANPSNRRGERYIFEHGNDRVSYGGYACQLDETSTTVIEFLKSQMDAAFEENLNRTASSFIEEFENEPESILGHLRYHPASSNFHATPILHLMDKSRFAQQLFFLIQNERELAKQVASEISLRSREEFKLEHPWIDEMKEALQSRAIKKSRLDGAQIKQFIGRYF